jgi:hypothetical protein
LKNIYDGVDGGIADGIAIEKGGDVYIIDSGKDNGKIDFGVRKKLKKSDANKRKLYIQKINEGAVQNGFVDRKLFGKLGVIVDNNSRSNVGRERRKNTTANKAKPQNNQSGISRKNANYGRLKPIDKDYFATVNNGYMKIADRMVDEETKKAGYTIKAYHGSRSVFNAFDKSKLGSNTKTEISKRWFFARIRKRQMAKLSLKQTIWQRISLVSIMYLCLPKAIMRIIK